MILEAVLLILGYITLFFVIAQIKKDNSIIDIGWPLGFQLLNIYFFVTNERTDLKIALFIAITLWSSTLAANIHKKKKGKGEDPRYQAWRKSWKHPAFEAYTKVFLLQGVMMGIIALPILLLHTKVMYPQILLAIIGIVIFLAGFIIETLADKQLEKFKRTKKKGDICKKGLWKYSRHPNYFGEITLWWGIGLMAFAGTTNYTVFIGPLLLTVLLTKVSGIPLTEKRYKGNKAYDQYKKTTSVLIPWFPKK